MKVWLNMQEGPGAGPAYPLDPFLQPVLSVGRGSECDIVVRDQRASRHHCDLRWNGRQWEVVDRGSTNGTYINGMQVHRPYELRPGDRVTIGETTMVLRESGTQPPAARQPEAFPNQTDEACPERSDRSRAPFRPAAPTPPQPGGQPGMGQGRMRQVKKPHPTVKVAFWLVQGVLAAAVVCLAAGAFLPWLRVTGSLSQELEPLLQGIANMVAILSGPDSVLSITQEIGGLEGYGKLTLAIALVSLLTLVVDLFFYRRSAVPAIVYLVSGLIATAAIAFDLVNYYRFYDEMKDLGLLFGVRLEQVVQVFDQFLDVQVTPMIGLVLTGSGLALLLAGGIGRLVVALLERSR